MNIKCSECQATYKIDESKVPTNGAKAKCTKCGSVIIINKMCNNNSSLCTNCKTPRKTIDTECSRCGLIFNNTKLHSAGTESISSATSSFIQNNQNTKEQYTNKPSYPVDTEVSVITKECPYCKETILFDAIKCKWCKSDILSTDKISNPKIVLKKIFLNYWEQWNLGQKSIFCSMVIGFISLFFNWVDIGIISQNGWKQKGYLLLFFYIYPCYTLIKHKKINWYVGTVISLLLVLLSVGYINSKSIDIFSASINVSSTGCWIFLSSIIVFFFGVTASGNKEFSFDKGFGLANLINDKKQVVFLVFCLLIPICIYAVIQYRQHIETEAYETIMKLTVNSTNEEIDNAKKFVEKIHDYRHASSARDHANNLFMMTKNDIADANSTNLHFLGLNLWLVDRSWNLTMDEAMKSKNTR